jgi:glyoxylase-like metal-dependent hydrolase (beta-lactamase superfamily II)
MGSRGTSSPRIDLLVTGSGINFQQGDLALSTIALIRSQGSDGKEVRTVVDTGHVGMRRNILEALVKHGLTVEEIDVVLLTHAHWDHVQNVDLFPNAKIVLSRTEWTSIQRDTPRDLMTPVWTKHLLPEDRVVLVEPGDDIIPGVELIAAPGHTLGCLALAIQLDQELAIITADAIPWAEVARLERSALVFGDVEKSQETIRKLVKRADVMYPGHDRPFRLVNGKVEYLTAFDMTMFGADPSTPGLKFGPPAILATLDLTDGEPVGPRWTKEELRAPGKDS